ARIAKALPDIAWKVRATVDRNNALPTLPLSHVIENRHGSWRLYDSTEPAKIGQHCCHATFRHAAVFRIIDPIRVAGAVTRRNFRKPRRGRPILSASTTRLLAFAGGRGLQESKPEFALYGVLLLDVRCQRRRSSVR